MHKGVEISQEVGTSVVVEVVVVKGQELDNSPQLLRGYNNDIAFVVVPEYETYSVHYPCLSSPFYLLLKQITHKGSCAMRLCIMCIALSVLLQDWVFLTIILYKVNQMFFKQKVMPQIQILFNFWNKW